MFKPSLASPAQIRQDDRPRWSFEVRTVQAEYGAPDRSQPLSSGSQPCPERESALPNRQAELHYSPVLRCRPEGSGRWWV